MEVREEFQAHTRSKKNGTIRGNALPLVFYVHGDAYFGMDQAVCRD